MVSLGLNPVEDQNLQQQAMQNPYVPQPNSPGFFDNVGPTVSQQFAKGALSVENAGEDIASPFVQNHPDLVDNVFGSGSVQGFHDDQAAIKDAIVNTQIDPNTTGWLGQQLGGLAGMAVPLAVGAVGGLAGEAGMLGTTAYKDTKLEQMAKGVDEATATKVAGVQGGLNAALPFLPFGIAAKYVDSVLAKAGLGFAGGGAVNTVASIGADTAVSKIYKDAGYDQMAEQTKPFDAMKNFSEFVTGGVFGLMHSQAKTGAERVENIEAALPSTIDAGFSANHVLATEIDTAPGLPTDTETRNAHVDTMGPENQQRFIMGDDLDTSAVEKNGDFIAKPEDPEVTQAIADAQKEFPKEPEGENEYAANNETPAEAQSSGGIEADETTGNESGNNQETEQNDQTAGNDGGNSEDAASPDYHEQVAQQIAAENPDLQISQPLRDAEGNHILDAEGNPVSEIKSASDVLAEDDAAAASDKETASFIQQAIACAMRFGGME